MGESGWAVGELSIIHVLVDGLILQDAMNASTLSWMDLVFNVLDDVCEYLAPNDQAFVEDLKKLSEAYRQGRPLCRPPLPDGNG